MKKIIVFLSIVALWLTGVCLMTGCDDVQQQQPQAASGVVQAKAKVSTGADGLTAEQRNIKDRLEEDNKPGSIKHLYIISPYSGQVILYSTVRGKVTSGGKRLTPTTVSQVWDHVNVSDGHDWNWYSGFPAKIGEKDVISNEVLQDDGTYGHSGDYLYWWDVRGVYHQHYLTGGQIVHISSQPIPIKSVTINLETQTQK